MEAIAKLTLETRKYTAKLSGSDFARSLSIHPYTFTKAAVSLWETGQTKPDRTKMEWIRDHSDPSTWQHQYCVSVLKLLDTNQPG